MRGLCCGALWFVCVVTVAGCDAPVEETTPQAAKVSVGEVQHPVGDLAKASKGAREVVATQDPVKEVPRVAPSRRDPFESPVLAPIGEPVDPSGGFKLAHWLAGARLTAIISGTAEPRAMFTDSDGHGHILMEGALFKDGSRVVDIRSDGVAFKLSPSYLQGASNPAKSDTPELFIKLHDEPLAFKSPQSPLHRP